MKLQSMVRQLMCGAGLVLAMTNVAEAQATRTWVSGVGDDVNPCSRTAPCKTFAGAISKTAAGGYINVIDPGGFGAVTITKNLTIDGGPFMSSVLTSNGFNGININGAGIKVTLRNLDISGLGTGNIGVRIINAASVSIENVHITDFVGPAIDFNPLTAGILSVTNTSLDRTDGIFVTNGRAMIQGLSADLTPTTTTGVKAHANALVTVRDSFVAGGGDGFKAVAASAVINIENSVTTLNTLGVAATSGSTIRVSNSGVLSNSNTGLFNDGSSFIISLSGNTVQGNPTPGVFTSTIVKQ
jgi:hypothetical protein